MKIVKTTEFMKKQQVIKSLRDFIELPPPAESEKKTFL